MIRRVPAGFLFATLVAVAASPVTAQSARTPDVTVRPIEDVFTDGPPRIADLGGEDGTLLFVSSVPLACSVVYGETTAFGQVAVDQDMNGGAHTNHHPALSGLKPDTLYHYRVQGTAANGSLYASSVMTFRTPVAAAAGVGPLNLASLEAGASIVAVSSNYGSGPNDGSFGANSAIDGRRTTEWSSNGDGDGGFVEIALSREARLGAVEVWTRSMSNNTAQIFKFTLTTDKGEVLGPYELPDAAKPHRFEIDVTAKSLRLDVISSNGGNVGLVEFAAFEAQ
jgi:hypothetical protein